MFNSLSNKVGEPFFVMSIMNKMTASQPISKVEKMGVLAKDGPKAPAKEGKTAEITALSIQCCDWTSWFVRAKSANHSTESRGLTFRLLISLAGAFGPSLWTVLVLLTQTLVYKNY